MANREVNLTKRIETPHGWRYCRVVLSAKGRAHDRRLGNGRIDDALDAEAVNEAVGDVERAAVDPDVFSDAEHARIALHLFPDSLADGFEVGHGRHGRSLAFSALGSYAFSF